MGYGERLASALQAARKSREELAAACEISVQAISQVLTGKTKALTAENNARAAQFLGADPYWLATGDYLPGAKRTPFRDLDPLESQLITLFRRFASEEEKQAVVIELEQTIDEHVARDRRRSVREPELPGLSDFDNLDHPKRRSTDR